MNKFSVGSFYSENSPYQKIWNDYLLKSCNKFNIKTHIMSTPNYRNWNRNVAEKPRVIGEMLDLFVAGNECLVFLDADAVIEKDPVLFKQIPLEYDIAFHTLDWNLWYGYNNTPAKKEVLSGTLFLRNKKVIRDLCSEWYEEAKNTRIWEQKILENLIGKYNLEIYPLPLDYCFPISRPKGPPLVSDENVVIRHHQVSRELKRKKL